MIISRRTLLAGMAGAALLPGKISAQTTSLKAAAASRGIVFGCQIGSPNIPEEAAWEADDPAFFKHVIDEAAELVSGGIMKWGYVEWDGEGKHNFYSGDKLLSFASRNGLKVRGHCLVWHQNLPQWFPTKAPRSKLLGLIENHVTVTATHWRGRLSSWDVVNEVIEPSDGLKGGLRNTIFSRTTGHDFIDLSFQWARAADPNVVLVLNETNLEYGGRVATARRIAILRLLERMKAKGVPCDALGIQAHLIAGGSRFDAKSYRQFLADVASLGYDLLITELDVDDRKIRKSDPKRSQKIADETGRFLDAALDEKAVKTVITWGLSTKYSWLNYWDVVARRDRSKTFGLPLDEQFNRTPMYDQMIKSFIAAPDRSA